MGLTETSLQNPTGPQTNLEQLLAESLSAYPGLTLDLPGSISIGICNPKRIFDYCIRLKRETSGNPN